MLREKGKGTFLLMRSGKKYRSKTIDEELSISFLQARGSRNKAWEWIVKIVMIQVK